eukprot:gnl/Dysnectes_brevis/2231_a2606_1696.p1 GENE.gnl/Dysnectes_brevis/2231_a2606_1696~~gnl/Dysnectes_brevis/2231_a2606_1696.p1  ORF type:complete len:276 (+),score=72.86 gnl/Dysnectes_brevis/2231_a2606_1696:41-868(+)
MLLSSKTAVISGASSGIGRGIALKIVESGISTLVILGRNQARLQSLEDELKAHKQAAEGLKIISIDADLATDAGMQDCISRIKTELGSTTIDVLVNSVGGVIPTAALTADKTTSLAYDQMMTLNFKIPVMLISNLSDTLTDGSSVVLLSSLNATSPESGGGLYCAPKAALNMYVKCAALDLGERGIRVNSVSPGYVSTPFHDLLFPSLEVRKLVESKGLAAANTLQGMVTPEDVANSVLFLATDMGRMVTGTDLLVDAGLGVKANAGTVLGLALQ